ncbi:hypothetical protein TNCV_2699181 [Trichonephila clavipes]|nr:hypothetical protein TNCV_2699181 [Trichonephila clavipes]
MGCRGGDMIQVKNSPGEFPSSGKKLHCDWLGRKASKPLYWFVNCRERYKAKGRGNGVRVLDESRSFFRVHTLGISREVYKSRVHRQLGMFSVQCCIELQALE